MRSTEKKYNTQYKKRVVEGDPYLPRRTPAGVTQCAGCGAFGYRARWSLDPPRALTTAAEFRRAYCPACRKTRDHFPGGELHLLGVEARERSQVAKILRNEEARARRKNPLEQIMSLQASNGDWRVETTTEKLAQRLGRSIQKARGGRLQYKWGHNNKFARVYWATKRNLSDSAGEAPRGRSSTARRSRPAKPSF